MLPIDNAEFETAVVDYQRTKSEQHLLHVREKFFRPLARMVVKAHPHDTRLIDIVIDEAVDACQRRAVYFGGDSKRAKRTDETAFNFFYRICRNVATDMFGRDVRRKNAEWQVLLANPELPPRAYREAMGLVTA